MQDSSPLVPLIFVLANVVANRIAPVRLAPLRSALIKSAPVRFAKLRSAPRNATSLSFVKPKSASRRSAPHRSVLVRSVEQRSAPLRSGTTVGLFFLQGFQLSDSLMPGGGCRNCFNLATCSGFAMHDTIPKELGGSGD